jgi:hypothetical protein
MKGGKEMKRKLVAMLLVLAVVLNLGLVPTVSVGADSGLGLVGLWHFDGNTSDSSGVMPPNNGVPSGGPGYTTGKFNQGINLDGIDDYVEIPDSSSLDITNNLTIEAWVYLDKLTAPYTCIVTKTAPSQARYSFVVGGQNSGFNGRVAFFVSKDGSPNYSAQYSNTILNLGQWYHIAGTYEFQGDGSSVMKVFVNGALDSTPNPLAVGPIFSGSSPLRIGARITVPICSVDGIIDEVRIYNTALSSQVIALHYAGCYEPNGRIEGQVKAGGTGISNVQVNATDTTTNQFVAGVRSIADGTYTINLPAGSYLV